MDFAGNVHLIFNQQNGASSGLCYRYSIDQGQTFSAKSTLLAWTSTVVSNGEYQSILLGNDGLFHITYVDWNDNSTAKHLVFAPMLTPVYETYPSTNIPVIFPNPAHNNVYLQSDFANEHSSYDLISLTGDIMMAGKIVAPKTSLNISQLKEGIYLFRIYNGNTTYIQKLIKE